MHAIHAHGEADALVHSYLNSALLWSGQLQGGRFITTTPTAAGSHIVRVTYSEGVLQKGAEEDIWT